MAKMIESRLNVRGHRRRTYKTSTGELVHTVEIPETEWYSQPVVPYRRYLKRCTVEILKEDYVKMHFPRYTVPRPAPGGRKRYD